MSSISHDISRRLLDIEAVRVSMDPPFTWTSGIKSPIYCDNRRLISYPEHRQAVVSAWKALLEQRVNSGQMAMPDVLGGTATAAIPWAAFLAYELNLPMVYIRPKPKGHGAGKQVEGDLQPGQTVLIVEDLVSTGGSSVRSAEAVRREGQCTVTDVFAIVTYQFEKADAAFAEGDLSLTTLTQFQDLISMASEQGSITSEQRDMVLKFKEDPASWGDRAGLV